MIVYESQQELDSDSASRKQLGRVRAIAAQMMGLSDAPDLGIPKIAIIAPPRDGATIASRYFVSSNCHPVFAATGALALAAACHTPDTIAEEIAELDQNQPHRIVIEHPSGKMSCNVVSSADPWSGVPKLVGAAYMTSARPLLTGDVFVADHCLKTEADVALPAAA